MKNRTDGGRVFIRIAGFMLVIFLVCLPDNSHGQPLVPVQEFDELDAMKQLVWTLQTVLAPRTLAQVERLYAYDPQRLDGERVYPEMIGEVATVRPFNGNIDRMACCAQYFGGDANAVRRAYDSVTDNDGACPVNEKEVQCYFATTRPLPEIEHARSFVAGLPQ